jgi:hypothetical protein
MKKDAIHIYRKISRTEYSHVVCIGERLHKASGERQIGGPPETANNPRKPDMFDITE